VLDAADVNTYFMDQALVVFDDNFDWQPPVEKPQDNLFYIWDEESLNWVVQETPLNNN
jgi:hypothetical protein